MLQSRLSGPVGITAAGAIGSSSPAELTPRGGGGGDGRDLGLRQLQDRSRVTRTTTLATLPFTRVSPTGSEALPAGKRQFAAILSHTGWIPPVKTNRERHPWSLLTSTAGTTQAALFVERGGWRKNPQVSPPPSSAPSLLPRGVLSLFVPEKHACPVAPRLFLGGLGRCPWWWCFGELGEADFSLSAFQCLETVRLPRQPVSCSALPASGKRE